MYVRTTRKKKTLSVLLPKQKTTRKQHKSSVKFENKFSLKIHKFIRYN